MIANLDHDGPMTPNDVRNVARDLMYRGRFQRAVELGRVLIQWWIVNGSFTSDDLNDLDNTTRNHAWWLGFVASATHAQLSTKARLRRRAPRARHNQEGRGL